MYLNVICVSVYVKVGSEQYFSDCLLTVQTPENEKQCQSGAKVKVPGQCNFCSIPSNCITWCKTELVRAIMRHEAGTFQRVPGYIPKSFLLSFAV